MADASDSKSDEGDLVWVQVPSPAFNGVYLSAKKRPYIYCRMGQTIHEVI